ncbi:MAG: HAMP domain-containing histidine kinase [Burkholderiales bacterium]|nr:HAMP domain-containing histidine kinase [Burkholderiales bacterium]
MRRGNVLAGGAFKAALFSLAAFIVVLVALGSVVYYDLSRAMARDVEAQVTRDLMLFREIEAHAGVQALIDAFGQFETPAVSGDRAAGLFDERGKRLAGNLNIVAEFDGWTTQRIDELLPQASGRYRLYSARVREGSALRIVVGRSIAALEGAQRRLLGALLLAGLAVIATSVGVGYWISRRVYRKLLAVSDVLEAVSRGDMARRIPIHASDDQVDRVAARINQHLDRLSALATMTKNTINAIAHELRSPITRVSIKVQEAIADQGMPEHREKLEEIATEIEGVVAIFDAIMRILHVEASSGESGFTLVPVSELFAEMDETFGPLLDAAGQRLIVDGGRLPALYGDARMLRQMLGNLIENASRHCPAGTTVRLAATQDRGSVTLSVSDDGPGIPPDQREAVLRPFHRLGSSRTTPGYGLGLPLVDAIAARHGAELALGDNAPGLIVAIRFPSPPPKITKM